ncbi:phosphatidylcholine:ceramide cholinephosphotransferase 1 [Parasteatoda tepidariorum]|uniref:phosphatidylcholine:ceramide cholinephosphotransferase 1 n=1 Tax=Parasteatoda tepidariorum TaxID=114398 RepID=UPI001C71DF18|nr:phosphatidylcholine:ceramide cholinephosphotransferase 1 [Parasteatoda tepidariorum]XP_042901051.1 phosphatidylcholine:ceramide cholinephosphotransferase 1 [Parasteatoda tepidariorum]XP_042901052.1 phosphatidylcholine:ceramide cholinephosphotransferase 1 [Parasteatoda tepidariorum]XP_042901053.1 phosphatidylcholine:ceramide cholinephosphotransferase 1 [Parasteatoda tepidariorum]XP_042901054.1 phosphatidylcholine:ceramide cholinephosphotransferase 1 [Parasteatoda tepidariorum]
MSSNTSAEEQPLLLNNNMGKGLSWENKDHRDPVTDLHIHVESLHNGLSRREKNGDIHGSQDGSVKINLPPPERDEPRFPPEKWKTFLGFIFLAFNMAWTLTVLAIVHERMPDRTKYKPLPDIFFDVFPAVEKALDVSEVIIIISVWLTILVIIMHKHRFIILRRCFVIIGLLYFMRSITMFVTQVPVASTTYYCSPKANSTSPLLIVTRVLYMMSGFGLSINGKHTFCGDYIYSGHTVVLTMAYLVIREYSPKRFYILHWLVWISSCSGVFMVLLSRGHYTVDVVIGYYVTTRVFWIYHTMANNAALKVPGNNNYLSRIWWFSIFSYFEKNVGGVVPRQYEWPLPWPRRFSKHTRIS